MSAPRTAAEIVKKWRRIELEQRSAAQAHGPEAARMLPALSEIRLLEPSVSSILRDTLANDSQHQQ